MKRLSLLFFVFFVQLSTIAQHHEINKYEVDTLQFYDPEQTTYTFYLEAGSQGLFVNHVNVTWLPQIRVRIVNNTGKTIENDFRERDAHLMWYRSKWNKTLKPGEEMILVSKWLVSREQQKVWLNRNIDFNYQVDSANHQFSIKTWGEFIVAVEKQQAESDAKKAALAEKEAVKTSSISTSQKVAKPTQTAPTTPPVALQKFDSIRVVKRKSYYKGEEVNRTTRKGFRKGKWVQLYANNQLKTEEFYSGRDFHWDSAYYYYEITGRIERKLYHVKLSDSAVMKREFNDRGIPTKTYLWSGKVILEPENCGYYASGAIQFVVYPHPNKYRWDYAETGEKEKYTSFNIDGNVDTIKYFFPNGRLKSLELMDQRGKVKTTTTFDQDGDILRNDSYHGRYTNSFKYLYKSDSLYVVERYYNGQHTYTDTGFYKGNDLWSGKRYRKNGNGFHFPDVYENGRINGFLYHGEWVNKSDSMKQYGRWIQLYSSGQIREDAYRSSGRRDSVFTYFESGALQSVKYLLGPFSHERRQEVIYYEDGAIRYEKGGFGQDTTWIQYTRSGKFDKLQRANGFVYHFENGNTCNYTIERPNFLSRENRAWEHEHRPSYYYEIIRRGPVEDYYKNCRQYKRITSRYYVTNGIEGDEGHSNPYQIETGSFKDDQLYRGTREYYDDKSNLIRSVCVVNGKEI